MTEISTSSAYRPLEGGRKSIAPPDPDEVELRTLIARIAQADQTAMGLLYDATVAKLYAVARLILRNSHDAEEATCDAYTQIWHEAHRYDTARANVMGWMLVMCRARAVDLLRRRRVRERVAQRYADDAQDDFVGGADDLLQSLQSGSRVRDALETLPEVRRRAVAMAFLQDLSHEEIAVALELPIGTVKSHIRRGLTALRAACDEENAL
jgi:RNA polymerase sigma-70 factor (ECF subfamily)